MVSKKIFSALSLSPSEDPLQRRQTLEGLPPDSEDMARFLTSDPDPQIRRAAAQRCRDVAVLQRAWAGESDAGVRDAIGAALTAAIDAIASEDALVELALTGERAETRIAAAARVQSPEALRKLADAAKDKDRGVARLARQRIDAMQDEARRTAECDAICAQLETLASEPGAILTAVIELDRRWNSLGLAAGDERHERFHRVRHAIQERFEREQDQPKRRFHFERRLRDLVASLDAALADPVALERVRAELAALKREAGELAHEAALAQIEQAEQRLRKNDADREALAAAEQLVAEAEAVAPDATDSAALLSRWYALDAAARTSALKRRFKAAVATIDQRRLEQQQNAKQDATARRHQLHAALHAAEQALAAGQLQAARTAADEVKALKAGTPDLPRPTQQRLSRLLQQLAELERWENFGQRSARTQLCERAEALSGQTLDAVQVAAEVKKLREEWKALDQQHAGVPKSLWQRFDSACEKAYAPAARHFAELAARNKEARVKRKEFIAAAQAKATALLGEVRDWRAMEHWLRDTERSWRDGGLGSVDPGSWKKLDAQLKAALAPVRDALASACSDAIARRRKLVEEAASLSSQAQERDAPGRIRELQARWQAEAKSVTLPRRDERDLWEAFRSACDAVFQARDAGRKQAEQQRTEARSTLEALCAELERIAADGSLDDQALRRAAREVDDRWNAAAAAASPRELQARFRKAKSSVDTALAARANARKSAVWEQLAQKERLCEELDQLIGSPDAASRSQAIREQWDALPALPPAWEKRMTARRDAALAALADEVEAGDYRAEIEEGNQARRQMLVELELALGLETPAEDRAQRLALQVKRLKERFDRSTASAAEGAGDQLLGWCATPGVCAAPDRERSERIFSRIRQTPLS